MKTIKATDLRLRLGATILLLVMGVIPSRAFDSRIGLTTYKDAPNDWRWNNSDRAQAQDAYWHHFADALQTPFSWTGDVSGLVSGTVSQDWRSAYISAINYQRYLTLAPANAFRGLIQLNDATWQQAVQDAALVTAANRNLSHHIDASWVGYSDSAAKGCANSNLSYSWSTGILAMPKPDPTGYILDSEANNTLVYHRRSLLNAYGSASCIGAAYSPNVRSSAVLIGTSSATVNVAGDPLNALVTFPGKGYIPRQLLDPTANLRISVTSAQSGATMQAVSPIATVTMGGVPATVVSTINDGDTVIVEVQWPASVIAATTDVPCTVTVSGLAWSGGVPIAAMSPRSYTWSFTLFDASAVKSVGYSSSSNVSNLSTRGTIGDNDAVMIGGFVVTGSQPIKVAIRTQGPGLAQYGVTGCAAAPSIELHQASNGTDTLLGSQNGWKNGANWRMVQSYGLNPLTDKESTAVCMLNPGTYTAVIRDPVGGVGIVEIFGIEAESQSHLTNVSTRGTVGTSNTALITGFVLQHTTTVVIRSQGPGLTKYGVSGAVSGTKMSLVRQSDGMTLSTNSGWDVPANARLHTDLQYAAPSDPREAAMVVTLPAGAYTAVIESSNGTPGVGIVEVFEISQP